MSTPDNTSSYNRIVVKIGTSVLSGNTLNNSLDDGMMSKLVGQISGAIDKYGSQILIVTSGAIAAGRAAIGSKADEYGNRDIISRQVYAAVGQGELFQQYQNLFDRQGIKVAQTLLTTNDLSHRQSYLNIRNTLLALLDMGIVPIINENDVVAVDEIGEVFGDNDRLSALVSNLIDADLLLILTDTDGLYTSDPRTNPSAQLISDVETFDDAILSAAGEHTNPWARGGMPTKIEAAQLVTTSGIPMIMCHGHQDDAILRALNNENIGTKFHPATEKLEARKRWLLSMMGDTDSGAIIIDNGAHQALKNHGVSLLPAGVINVDGFFERGDIVYVLDSQKDKIACGISNYNSYDITRIKGIKSSQIEKILGYDYGQEVVHRNNLVLI
ncbi:MAG: glutamate 5-kinase [Dehalococcoidia bacterium]|nr:glutamate 5-kinase [Dehalococcoidia bacterium]